MGPRAGRLVLTILISVVGGCRSDDGPSPATMERIRRAQDRWLTVDGNVRAEDIGKLLIKMKKGGLDAAVLMVPYWDAQATLARIRAIKASIEKRPELGALALTPEDAYRLQTERRRAVYLGLEIGRPPGIAQKALQALAAEGVSVLAVRDDGDEPASFWPEVVAECERLGVVVDLAGCSERAIRAALGASRAPVVISRASARAVRDRPGSLGDAVIGEIAAAGGVVLVSFEPRKLAAQGEERRAAVADVVDHIEHIARVAGIDGVGIGSGFGDGGGVAGCRDPSDILAVTVEMLRRGFGESEVERVWGGNLMRVLLEAGALAGR